MIMLNFELILTFTTLLTGLIWLLEKKWWAPARKARLQKQLEDQVQAPTSPPITVPKMSWAAEYSRSFFPVLALVLVLRSFLYEPFQIPSGSMLPTLEIGDFIVVNKFTYGLRLPVIGQVIVPLNTPKRGDVMVFRYPKDPSINFIKRVVGVPGDTISQVKGDIYINGKKLPKRFIKNNNSGHKVYDETLDDVKHLIWQKVNSNVSWTLPETVPKGHYFMLGDNRDGSSDSRVWGYVSEEYIIGRADAIWMQWKGLFNLPRFDRVGIIQ